MVTKIKKGKSGPKDFAGDKGWLLYCESCYLWIYYGVLRNMIIMIIIIVTCILLILNIKAKLHGIYCMYHCRGTRSSHLLAVECIF